MSHQRKIYIRIKSATIPASGTNNYDIYTRASDAEGTGDLSYTTKDAGNITGTAHSGSYTGFNARFSDIWPKEDTTYGVGRDVYEFFVYNATSSTIYLTSDDNNSVGRSIAIAASSWSTSTSGLGHNPFDVPEPYYRWTVHTLDSTTVGGGGLGYSTNEIFYVEKFYAYFYVYITAVSTSNITYTVYSEQDYSANRFFGEIQSSTTGTSLTVANSYKPAHHSIDGGSSFNSTTGINPSYAYIYISNTVYGTGIQAQNDSDSDPSTGWGTPSFMSSSYFTPSATDGSVAGSDNSWSININATNLLYPTFLRISAYGGTPASSTIFTLAAVCFPPFTLIETPNGLTQISDLKVGDEVITQRGIVKVSKNMTTQTPGGGTFVFFPKDSICEGFPSEDAYITEFHPIAIKNVEEDNKDVMHFIAARHFLNKFKGIELKKLDTKTYHNLVFDTVEIFNVGGMKMCSHHPNNTPIKLRKDEFLGEVNERKPINKRYTFEKLSEDKKEDEDLGEFLKKKLSYN